MTRFRVILIEQDQLLCSNEFNGDGYWEGHGHTVYRRLREVNNAEDLKKLLFKINKNFGYEEDRIYLIQEDLPSASLLFDSLEDYLDKMFSDYLYIKNVSQSEQVIITPSQKVIRLAPQKRVVLEFGELYKIED